MSSAGFGEGQKARHVELRVVLRHGQTARLEMARAVGIVGEGVAQIHMADHGLAGGVDDRDGVLRAVGDKDPQAVRRRDNVPRLGPRRDVGEHRCGECSPRRIVDLNDRDRVARGIGDVSELAVGRERDALRFSAHSDLRQPRVVVRANHAHAVVARIDGPDQPVIERDGDGAGVGGSWPHLRLDCKAQRANRDSGKAEQFHISFPRTVSKSGAARC